jgi:ADP-ribose pyrophosphatase YjhB (NUDIX family)
MENVPAGKKYGVGFGVMMVRDGKILLGRRHEDPNKADSVFKVSGVWTMPGGKLGWGEELIDAAKREVKEETGMTLNSAEVICVSNDMNEHAHFVTVGFYSEDFNGEALVTEPDEITEWRWFDINNIQVPLYFPSQAILKNYQSGTFYQPR